MNIETLTVMRLKLIHILRNWESTKLTTATTRLTSVTPDRLNARNRDFWDHAQRDMDRRLADPEVRETALEAVESEAKRLVPVYSQLTIEAALTAADRTKRRLLPGIRTEIGRQGDRAAKADPLLEMIHKIVERNPTITWPSVLEEIRTMEMPEGVIEEITEHAIELESRGGRLKKARISGLKDRVSRAKKKVRSLKAASANSVS